VICGDAAAGSEAGCCDYLSFRIRLAMKNVFFLPHYSYADPTAPAPTSFYHYIAFLTGTKDKINGC
jgi:hypothetical protein